MTGFPSPFPARGGVDATPSTGLDDRSRGWTHGSMAGKLPMPDALQPRLDALDLGVSP
jgi:hypothetical protein